MATLAHINDSKNSKSDQTINEKIDAGINYSSQILDTKEIKQGYVIFRLVKKKTRRLRLDGICDNCLNPKTGKRERAYLIRGAHSIWQSELGDLIRDLDKPNSYINKNRMSITFEDGICRIPISEENQLEFARVNLHNVGKNRNGAGKYDYYEYDAHEEQKLRFAKAQHRIKMISTANEMPIEKAKRLAAFLGISFVDELGQPKGEDGVRSELMLKADSQPELFEKYLDSKEVDISYMVRRAIIEAKIDLTAQNGNALWAGGKGFIAKIPAGRKHYEYLTEFAMTNSEEGRNFLEQLTQVSGQ